MTSVVDFALALRASIELGCASVSMLRGGDFPHKKLFWARLLGMLTGLHPSADWRRARFPVGGRLHGIIGMGYG